MEKVKRTPASLKKMVETFGMEILHRGSDYDSAVITISDVNRPALQLVGFYDYFDDKRLQILGRGEIRYLERMTEAERLRVFNQLMSIRSGLMVFDYVKATTNGGPANATTTIAVSIYKHANRSRRSCFNIFIMH